MLRRLIIKLLGGYTASEIEDVRRAELKLSETVRSLEPYKEFAASISLYAGNYPAWKAQSEYREMLSDLGHPISGQYQNGTSHYPTHAENVDLYLGRVVDGFAELCRKLPEAVPGSHWDSAEKLASARGEIYLQRR